MKLTLKGKELESFLREIFPEMERYSEKTEQSCLHVKFKWKREEAYIIVYPNKEIYCHNRGGSFVELLIKNQIELNCFKSKIESIGS